MTPTLRFAQIRSRTEFFTLAGRLLMTLGIIAAVCNHRRVLIGVTVLELMMVGGSFGYDRYLKDQLGTRGEIARVVLLCTLGVVTGHISHWPLAIWFTLPFVALITDPLTGRNGVGVLAAVTVTYGAVGVWDGTPWHVALGFSATGWLILAMAQHRGGAFHQMLEEARQQNTELTRAHRRLTSAVDARDRMELELRQAQKLEAVGRLAAGVAHEINTPVQFVSDSVLFVKSSMDDTLPLIKRFQKLRNTVASVPQLKAMLAAIAEAEEAADLEYVLENVPSALDRTLDGLQRIATIVKSLKEFAHPDSNAMSPVDINRAIESTLTIAKHEYKLVADAELQLTTVPQVTCHPGEINQVVLNIVVNAAHAIEDVVREHGGRGKISITTALVEEDVVITIADTGGGIPESVRDRIFDPFFTTKEVGRGTGQGLAIAKTVVEKHGGKLSFTTELGKGTTFTIRLPQVPKPAELQSGAYCVVPMDHAAA